jgi:hypothetical protein
MLLLLRPTPCLTQYDICFTAQLNEPLKKINYRACADDLPVWGFIGEKETEIVHGVEQNVYYLFTHYIFSITHNGDQVCERTASHPNHNSMDGMHQGKTNIQLACRLLKSTGSTILRHAWTSPMPLQRFLLLSDIHHGKHFGATFIVAIPTILTRTTRMCQRWIKTHLRSICHIFINLFCVFFVCRHTCVQFSFASHTHTHTC